MKLGFIERTDVKTPFVVVSIDCSLCISMVKIIPVMKKIHLTFLTLVDGQYPVFAARFV